MPRLPRPDDLSLGGLTDANRRLKEIADSLARISSGQQRLQVGGRGASLAGAQRNLILARAVGDPLQQRDALEAFQRAQGRFAGGGFGSRLSTFVRSTRFGAGGFSPLIGRGMDLLGMGAGAMGGPVGIAATVAAAALKGLADATSATVVHMRELGDAARVSGGTPGQVARLAGMGIPVGEIAGRAAQIRQTITQDPFGRIAAARLGVRAIPGPQGEVNQAADYEKLLEGLRAETNLTERLRLARMLGMEADLKYLDVSKDVQATQKEIAEGTARIFDRKHVQAANDLDASWGNVTNGLKNLGGGLTREIIRPLSDFLNSVAIGATFAPDLLSKGIEGTFGPEAAWKKLYEVQQEMIGATKENTNALRAQQEGMFGAGEMARGAIGAGMQGDYLRHGIVGNAMRMGAFRL